MVEHSKKMKVIEN